MLIDGIDILSIDVIRDLQLLTVGPQLRGGENARLGQLASKEVYSLLRGFMAKYLAVQVPQKVSMWAADLFGPVSIIFDHPVHK